MYFFILKIGVLVHVEVITTTMECCIAYLCSRFSEVVHYRKSVKQRKPKAVIKRVCHRFGKSVSVDGQENADKNWSMQSKRISNDQELIQSDPTSCRQNQKGNN